MANQDFDINIRVNANTAQVDAIRQSFEKLGAQVKVTNAEAAGGAGGLGGEGGVAGIAGLVARLAGVSLAGVAYQFIDSMKKAAEESAKVSAELDKQGAQLVENTQLFSVQAKHATDAADVIKISDNALKEMAKTQATLNELSQKELGLVEETAQYLQRHGLEGQELTAQQINLQTASSQAAQAQAAAIREIDDAQKAQKRGLDEIISDLQRSVELEQKHADTARAANNAVDYAKAVNALNRYNQELDKANKRQEQQQESAAKAHDQLTSKTEKYVEGADPQVKAILANEKAMFEARAGGREQDAAMYERSALRLRAGARPDQLAEVDKIYGGKEVVDALKELGRNQREQIDLWK